MRFRRFGAPVFHMTRRCLPAMVAIGAVALGGCARHRVASSFAELEPRLKAGQSVHVTTVAGDVRKGTLEMLSAGSAQVNVSGATVRIPEGEIATITVREPIRQGAIVGALTGAALGSVAQGAGEAYGCAFGVQQDCVSSVPVAGMLVGAGIGGAIGAGIDALVWRRKRVYAAPGTTFTRVVVSPIATRRSTSIRVAIVF